MSNVIKFPKQEISGEVKKCDYCLQEFPIEETHYDDTACDWTCKEHTGECNKCGRKTSMLMLEFEHGRCWDCSD